MNRTELKISFQQKDAAKECAIQNGTRIMWDAGNKTWYWEGTESNLPECLKKYLPKPESESAKLAREQQAKRDAIRAAKEAEAEARRQSAWEPRLRALALEKEGKFSEALEILKNNPYPFDMEGNNECAWIQDISRLGEKVAGVFERKEVERAEYAASRKKVADAETANQVEAARARESAQAEAALADLPALEAAIESAEIIEKFTRKIPSELKYLRSIPSYLEVEISERDILHGVFESIGFDYILIDKDGNLDFSKLPHEIALIQRMFNAMPSGTVLDKLLPGNKQLQEAYAPLYQRFLENVGLK